MIHTYTHTHTHTHICIYDCRALDIGHRWVPLRCHRASLIGQSPTPLPQSFPHWSESHSVATKLHSLVRVPLRCQRAAAKRFQRRMAFKVSLNQNMWFEHYDAELWWNEHQPSEQEQEHCLCSVGFHDATCIVAKLCVIRERLKERVEVILCSRGPSHPCLLQWCRD